MSHDKKMEYLIGCILVIVFVLLVEGQAHAQGLRQVDATAYYDYRNVGISYDGKKLVPDLTIAGRKEDLGKTAILYGEDMKLIGIYEFRDIGYGRATGKGKSKVRKGMTVGTIENGTCVDIYFKTKAECEKFGRRKVYIQIINAKG